MIPTLAKTLSKITFLPCTYHLDTEAKMKGHQRLKPFEASPPCRPQAMQIPRAGPLVLGGCRQDYGSWQKELLLQLMSKWPHPQTQQRETQQA